MLNELDIRNVGPIKKASVSFGHGMTAITGETGAGKSMLLTAINMIMGEKPSRGKDSMSGSYAQGIFDDVEEPYRNDDDLTYVSRAFSRNGRSKCTINGIPSPLNSLQSITNNQITIHGQSEQMRLASDTMQTAILDTYADDGNILMQYHDDHEKVKEIQRKIALGNNQDLIGKREYLHDAIHRIEEADIHVGELEKLKTTLLHEEERQQSIEGRTQALHDINSAIDMLNRAMASYSDDGIVYAIDSIQHVSSALESSLSDDESIDIDGINERMYSIEGVIKRYGGTEESVLGFLERSRNELRDMDDVMQDSEAMVKTLNTMLNKEIKSAQSLTEVRSKAASLMQHAVNDELKHLSMPGASICIHISPSSSPKSNGYDNVDFLFIPFHGANPMPLGKSASGGELSRLMLAIELVVAEHAHNSMRTFVFDEVDAGVGGKAAADLGKRLARLAKQSQVIIVTHLAQVAAYADHQYIVDRTDGETTVIEAQGNDRALEISRMLSGEHDDISIQHASSLLHKCDEYRKSL